MVVYCVRCGKDFPYKCKLLVHLHGKRMCKPIFLNATVEEIEKNFDDFTEQFLAMKMEEVTSDNKNGNKKPIENVTSSKKFKCENCSKEFSFKNSYYRHRKHVCMVIKTEEKTEDLNVNYFGEEDLNDVNTEYIEKLLRTASSTKRIVTYLVETIWINNESNHNIHLKDIRSGTKFSTYSREKDRWVVANEQEIIDRVHSILDDAVDKVHDELDSIAMGKRIEKNYIKLSDGLDETDRSYYNRIISEIRRVIFNGRREVLKTHGGKIII